VQVIPATSDSNVGDSAAKTGAFYFLNGVNQLEPNAADGTQNPSLGALLTEDTKLEFNTGGAARNVLAYVADGNSFATRLLAQKGCHVTCVHSVCYITCKS
jgi:hypothetical protein